jgi:hypothetical protein
MHFLSHISSFAAARHTHARFFLREGRRGLDKPGDRSRQNWTQMKCTVYRESGQCRPLDSVNQRLETML